MLFILFTLMIWFFLCSLNNFDLPGMNVLWTKIIVFSSFRNEFKVSYKMIIKKSAKIILAFVLIFNYTAIWEEWPGHYIDFEPLTQSRVN